MQDITNTDDTTNASEVTIPRLDVDPDDSLTDRLTANVQHNIGPARYFDKDASGSVTEDWDDVFGRVAGNVAIADLIHHDTNLHVGENELSDWVTNETAEELVGDGRTTIDEEIVPYLDYDELCRRATGSTLERLKDTKAQFESAMREQRFMPNTPTLINAGTELQQLSACFVREIGDSISAGPDDFGRDSIMQVAEDAASIFKSGGGLGYPAHLMRPKGARVSSTGGVSSGPMSFAQIYDTVCNTVKQGGVRRGAQMLIMHAQHPDIGRFAVSKRDEDNLSNFNISVGVTDEFLEAAEAGETYTMYDPEGGYVDPRPFKVVPETAHFYDPQFEDSWNDEFDKPAEGLGGKNVEENFWRDHLDEMGDPEAFEQYRSMFEPTTETVWTHDETGEEVTSKPQDDVIDLWSKEERVIEEADVTLEVGEPLELPAGLIYQMMIDGAHHLGEPGFFNIDETNRQHSFDVEENPEEFIHSTNPCVTGDTRIATGNGLQRAEDLYQSGTATDVVVDSRLSDDRTKEASNVYQTGVKDVVKLTTSRGYELRLTPDHRVKTSTGWVEAGEFSTGDRIHIQDRKGSFGSHGSAELGRVLGWIVGDGYLKEKEGRAVLSFQGDETHLGESFAEDANAVVRSSHKNRDYTISSNQVNRSGSATVSESRVRSTRLYELAEDAGLVEEKMTVPEPIFNGSEEQASGFLSALFSADGQVSGTKENGLSVRLTSVSTDLLKEVQTLLLNFGIASTIYTDRHEAGVQEMPDGNGGTAEYECQARHDLVVSKDNLIRFNDEIGFVSDRKQNELDVELDKYTRGPYGEDFTAEVESVEPDGTEAVYDLTEPDTESFVGNGAVVHNCAEQPLSDNESCTLGHVNLSLLVRDDAPTFAEFVADEYDVSVENIDDAADDVDTIVTAFLDVALNQERFESTAKMGTHFLDNVVSMSKFPLEEITEVARTKRKIGVGLMGYHQMCMQLGVSYGSEIGFQVASETARRLDTYATEQSHELAGERGVFERFEDSKWADPERYPEWIESHGHVAPEDYPDGYAVRNHNMTTVAPTGTTSMISDTTGGCEPLYNVCFFKNVGDDIQGDEMLVEWDDYFLDVLEANDINVDEVQAEATDLMDAGDFDGVDDLETVPQPIADLFVTTEDLSVEQHIGVQAAMQEYIDSGLSKTLNISNDATIDEVGEAIQLANELGIKGATVYRVGSRTTEVKTTNKSGGAIAVSEADENALIEELEERIEDNEDVRATVMDALNVADTSTEIVDNISN